MLVARNISIKPRPVATIPTFLTTLNDQKKNYILLGYRMASVDLLTDPHRVNIYAYEQPLFERQYHLLYWFPRSSGERYMVGNMVPHPLATSDKPASLWTEIALQTLDHIDVVNAARSINRVH